METNEPPQNTVEGAPSSGHSSRVPVTADSMERELRRVWRETVVADQEHDQANGKEGDETPRVRAILSNLILLSSASHHIPREILDQFITEVCIAYPSRIFVVELDPEQSEPLLSFVSSRCVSARSGVRACSEEVYLKVNSEGIPLVANLLTSFFVADVPRVLALPGDPIIAASGGVGLDWPFVRLFRRVLTVSDRVVFDSSRFGNFFQSTKLLLSSAEAQVDAEHEEDDDSTLEQSVLLRLSDLNWDRTERWRSLIAELFDAEVLQALLGELRAVRFHSTSDTKGEWVPPETTLLAGWIVHALRLHLRGGKEGELSCVSVYGHDVKLHFKSTPPFPSRHELLSELQQVTFVFGDRAKGEVECSLEREGDRAELSVIVLEPGALTKEVHGSLRRVPFRHRSVEELFMQTMLGEGDLLFAQSFLSAFRVAGVFEQERKRRKL